MFTEYHLVWSRMATGLPPCWSAITVAAATCYVINATLLEHVTSNGLYIRVRTWQLQQKLIVFFLQTISRTSSRRSRAGSSQSKKPGDKGQSSASDSENEDTRTRVSDFDNQADIMDEKAWETDLEPEGINSFILFFKEEIIDSQHLDDY